MKGVVEAYEAEVLLDLHTHRHSPHRQSPGKRSRNEWRESYTYTSISQANPVIPPPPTTTIDILVGLHLDDKPESRHPVDEKEEHNKKTCGFSSV